MDDKDFKIGDTVFYKIDPQWTTTGEGALECMIASVVNELDKYDGLSVKEYRIRFGGFDDDKYVKPEVIFSTKEAAIESLKKDVAGNIERLEAKLKIYQDLFNNY